MKGFACGDFIFTTKNTKERHEGHKGKWQTILIE